MLDLHLVSPVVAPNVQAYLERPVSDRLAAQKVAAIRGHYGQTGGWIYDQNGWPICQGWWLYASRCYEAGRIQQHWSGKYYVPVNRLSERDRETAERIFANRR